jgi:hypothetical protein
MEISDDKLRRSFLLLAQKSVANADLKQLAALLGNKQELVASLLLKGETCTRDRRVGEALRKVANEHATGPDSRRAGFADLWAARSTWSSLASEQSSLVSKLQGMNLDDEALDRAIARQALVDASPGDISRPPIRSTQEN